MGFFSNLFNRSGDEPQQPQLTTDELIEKLNYCKEHDLPVNHRIHGSLRVTRVEKERFFADSDVREGLMFPYKYFSDGLLTLPPEVL
ncbi:MAG: hypothetical protein J6A42_05110 [Firmicutes bacterium]|nr:hypothetical protein [Bacillota bacterium]